MPRSGRGGNAPDQTDPTVQPTTGGGNAPADAPEPSPDPAPPLGASGPSEPSAGPPDAKETPPGPSPLDPVHSDEEVTVPPISEDPDEIIPPIPPPTRTVDVATTTTLEPEHIPDSYDEDEDA